MARDVLTQESAPITQTLQKKKKISVEQSFSGITIELIAFLLFALVSIAHTWVDHTLFQLYETHTAMQQVLLRYGLDTIDKNYWEVDDFWNWAEIFCLDALEKIDEDTIENDLKGEKERSGDQQKIRLQNTNIFVASDLRITTRRLKMVDNEFYGGFEKWITDDFDPLSDPYDPLIEDTVPFQIGPNQTMAEHRIRESLFGLGGFVIDIDLRAPKSDLQRQIRYLREQSSFNDAGTISITADLLFFSNQAKTFDFLFIEGVKTTGGLFQFRQKIMRPIGQRSEDQLATQFVEMIERFEMFLVLLYFIKELIILVVIVSKWYTEKQIVSGIATQEAMKRKDQVLRGGDEDQQTGGILEGDKIPHRHELIKFYIDQKSQVEVTDNKPSLVLGLKNMILRDQRILVYTTCILIVPITILHQNWHKITRDLKINEVTFQEITDANSEFGQNRHLLNEMYKANQIESIQQIFVSLFTLCIMLRVFTLLSQVLLPLRLYFMTIIQIAQFLQTFIVTIIMIQFAFASFCHLYYGSELRQFQTIGSSMVTLAIMALGDTQDLEATNDVQPNVTVVIYFLFIFMNLYFLMNILIGFVMNKFNESIAITKQTKQKTASEIVEERHWTVRFATRFEQFKNRISCGKKHHASSAAQGSGVGGSANEASVNQIEVQLDEEKVLKKAAEQNIIKRAQTSMLSKQVKQLTNQKKTKKNQQNPQGRAKASLESSNSQNDSQSSSSGNSNSSATSSSNTSSSSSSKSSSENSDSLTDEIGSEIGSGVNESPDQEVNGESKTTPGNTLLGIKDKDRGSSSEQADSQDSAGSSDGTDDQDHKSQNQEITTKKHRNESENADFVDNLAPDEIALLERLDWAIEFSMWDLDADVNNDQSLTSTKEDAFLINQREQRCGKVIWTTALKLFYALCFVALSLERPDKINALYNQNQDILEYIMNLTVERRFDTYNTAANTADDGTNSQANFSSTSDTFKEANSNQASQLPFEKVQGLYEVFDFVDVLEGNFKSVEQEVRVEQKDNTQTVIQQEVDIEKENLNLSYFLSPNNYIVFQGSTVCFRVGTTNELKDVDKSDDDKSIVEEKSEFQAKIINLIDGNFQTLKDPLTFSDPVYTKSVKYFGQEFGGDGAYCTAFALNESRTTGEQFLDLLAEMQSNHPSLKVLDLKVQYMVIQANTDLLTSVSLNFTNLNQGLQSNLVVVDSVDIDRDNLALMLIILCLIMIVLNIYIQLNQEYNLYQRFKAWYDIKINPLSKLEKDQRAKQRPEIFRRCKFMLRPINLIFILHIMITFAMLSPRLQLLQMLGQFVSRAGILPTQAVRDHLILEKQDDEISEVAFETTFSTRLIQQIDLQKLMDSIVTHIRVSRRLEALNLLFVLTLPLSSTSQNKQVRFFVDAMLNSLQISLWFFVILFMILIGIMFYSLHSFGFGSVHFQSLTYTCMTMFKMFVGRQLGLFYRDIYRIDIARALVVTLPFILMKFLFFTIFLAIVSHQYNSEVLSQDLTSDINILRSIFFCNISLDKKQKNRRAKIQLENEALQSIVLGGGGNLPGSQLQTTDNQRPIGGPKTDLLLGGSNMLSGVQGKYVDDGLAIFEKLDLHFSSFSKIKDWAMNCADQIKSEQLLRQRMKAESQHLYKRLLVHMANHQRSVYSAGERDTRRAIHSERLDSLNLMSSRIRFITYIWLSVQFVTIQIETLEAVIKSCEQKIKANRKDLVERKRQTDQLYQYLYMLEEPVEQKLIELQKVKSQVKLLRTEKNLLQAFRSKRAVLSIKQQQDF